MGCRASKYEFRYAPSVLDVGAKTVSPQAASMPLTQAQIEAITSTWATFEALPTETVQSLLLKHLSDGRESSALPFSVEKDVDERSNVETELLDVEAIFDASYATTPRCKYRLPVTLLKLVAMTRAPAAVS